MTEPLTKSLFQQDPGFALNRQAELHSRVIDHKLKNANAGAVRNLEQIEEAAEDFEAVFTSEMLKPMFEEVKVDPMFGGGKSEEVFKDMMIQEYGKLISERGGIGMKDQVMAEMIRIQEGAQ